MEPFRFHELTSSEQARQVDREYLQAKECDIRCSMTNAVSIGRRFSSRNRYSDVMPYDTALFPPPSATGGPLIYINASYIPKDMFRVPHSLAAAQAPLPEYIDEWWTAIHYADVRMIVMLTQEVEGGMRKADRYWPSQVGPAAAMRVFPNATLTLAEEPTPLGHQLKMRNLDLCVGGTTKRIQQLQYEGWPDHGVPESVDGIATALHHLRAADPEHPVLVHCSAGIGRTGTFIAAYVATHRMIEGTLCANTIVDVVCGLRTVRAGMVQKRDQLAFLYRCVVAFRNSWGAQR